MSYVGCGQGGYIQETTYKYVGCGGDFDVVRRRRDFTCLITTCCLLTLLLPLLLWLLSGLSSTDLYDCNEGAMAWETAWSPAQQQFCCMEVGVGCTTRPATALPTPIPTAPPTPPPTMPPTPPPTAPPTPPPTRPAPVGPVDPFNCAVDAENTWAADKKAWCCRVHHRGCPPTAAPIMPILPPVVQPILPQAPADPYNCADGFANWQAGWSVGKKEWCCRVHGKGCPNQGGGCAPVGTTSPPYDCNAGFANWMAGWSVPKKAWCCQNAGKGCPPAVGGCA